MAAAGKEVWSGFLVRGERGPATEEDRAFLRGWLAAQPLVEDVEVGELADAWWPEESNVT